MQVQTSFDHRRPQARTRLSLAFGGKAAGPAPTEHCSSALSAGELRRIVADRVD